MISSILMKKVFFKLDYARAVCTGVLLFLYSIFSPIATAKLDVYQVTLDEGDESPIKKIADPTTSEESDWENRIFVDPGKEFQTIEGIGGAFNEIGGEALLSLDQHQQNRILNHLFSKDNAGFSVARTAMGASDFSKDAYSYAEVEEDYALTSFSIDRDKKYLLPYIQAALKINPQLTLFASPWSPPAWMKQNNSMLGLTQKPNQLRESKAIYRAYANYFVKYLQAYQAHGVNIDRVCIQNENDANTNYPSHVFPPEKMIDFSRQYLKPLLKQHKLSVGLCAGTFRAVDQLDLIDFISTPGARLFDSIGIQYTPMHVMADAKHNVAFIGSVASKHGTTSVTMFHTEGDCFNGQNSPEQARTRLNEIASYINSGLTTYTYWNMILNETTQSGWGWAQNSLIIINREQQTIRYTPDYNVIYLVSHFMQHGDRRIGSVSRGRHPLISVKDPQGRVKILIQNTHREAKVFEVVIAESTFKIKLSGNTISAIIFDKKK
jgi:glucosylceramidase